MKPEAPLFFAPTYQDYLWGGQRIPQRFHRPLPPGRYAESWEIADRPEGQSVVESGPHAGQTLHDLVSAWGPDLLGRGVRATRFPLLIKLLDARETLSVQVHPNNDNAPRMGGEPKTEMWYVLDAEPDACVYVGLQPGVTPQRLREAIAAGAVEPLLHRQPVRAGDAVFVPGGRVHAIGAGCLMLECQQNSNTTYRLYDWGRVGPDGRARELHVDAALQVIDWQDALPALLRPTLMESVRANARWELARCPYFRMERLDLRASYILPAHPDSFRILFLMAGEAELQQAGFHAALQPGRTVLIPAACSDLNLSPGRAGAQALLMDVPAP